MSNLRDVVVVGAGPGGSAAAYYLAQHGLDVLLLDKASFPRDKTCGDGLTPRALAALDAMGLLTNLLRAGYRVNRLEIIAPRGHAVDALFPGPGSLPEYALIVPRLILDNLIRERALASGAAFESPVRVTEVTPGADRVELAGEYNGRSVTFTSRAAVIATGASMPLLLRLGLLDRAPPTALAARAYFEGITGLSDQFTLRFDDVPLPGYGWIFPLSHSSANVGAGVFPAGWPGRRPAASSRAAFDAFVQAPALRDLLAGARQAGPVRGYPLRVDFASAPTCGNRVLLVGEAAGLVNPLTGEGIDYALESGKIAADQLAAIFAAGDFSPAAFAAYDRQLRMQFQRLFVFCTWARHLGVNRLMLDRMIRLGIRRPDLKMVLIRMVFGHYTEEHLTIRRLLKHVFAA